MSRKIKFNFEKYIRGIYGEKMKCPICKKEMENVKDQITKKINKHLWKCKICMPDKVISKG